MRGRWNKGEKGKEDIKEKGEGKVKKSKKKERRWEGKVKKRKTKG